MTNSETHRLWFTGERIQLALTRDQAESGCHQGRCDDDVDDLCGAPEIAAQLDAIDADTLAAELRAWGAWDDAELADHEQNKRRIVWLAASDIIDRNRP